nr:RNA-directed DNA polymerase, eukaryota, reverse transcriptase zinc-binding domain protein [Tanacetum cinerariifolium]
METNRRSSKRQQRIPTHFNDYVHDLNKKRDTNKNKGKNAKSKNVVELMDKANRECLDEDMTQNCIFDDLGDCEKNAKDDAVENGKVYEKGKDCSEQECEGVKVSAEKMMFGSVNDEMLTRNEGCRNVKLPTVSNAKPNANPKKSYASAAISMENLLKQKLMTVPTDIDEMGNEYVIFDEELINDGSKRWQLTLCGFFVGFKMRISELRYNVRRMWSRYGLKEVIENDS